MNQELNVETAVLVLEWKRSLGVSDGVAQTYGLVTYVGGHFMEMKDVPDFSGNLAHAGLILGRMLVRGWSCGMWMSPPASPDGAMVKFRPGLRSIAVSDEGCPQATAASLPEAICLAAVAAVKRGAMVDLAKEVPRMIESR